MHAFLNNKCNFCLELKSLQKYTEMFSSIRVIRFASDLAKTDLKYVIPRFNYSSDADKIVAKPKLSTTYVNKNPRYKKSFQLIWSKRLGVLKVSRTIDLTIFKVKHLIINRFVITSRNISIFIWDSLYTKKVLLVIDLFKSAHQEKLMVWMFGFWAVSQDL